MTSNTSKCTRLQDTPEALLQAQWWVPEGPLLRAGRNSSSLDLIHPKTGQVVLGDRTALLVLNALQQGGPRAMNGRELYFQVLRSQGIDYVSYLEALRRLQAAGILAWWSSSTQERAPRPIGGGWAQLGTLLFYPQVYLGVSLCVLGALIVQAPFLLRVLSHLELFRSSTQRWGVLAGVIVLPWARQNFRVFLLQRSPDSRVTHRLRWKGLLPILETSVGEAVAGRDEGPRARHLTSGYLFDGITLNVVAQLAGSPDLAVARFGTGVGLVALVLALAALNPLGRYDLYAIGVHVLRVPHLGRLSGSLARWSRSLPVLNPTRITLHIYHYAKRLYGVWVLGVVLLLVFRATRLGLYRGPWLIPSSLLAGCSLILAAIIGGQTWRRRSRLQTATPEHQAIEMHQWEELKLESAWRLRTHRFGRSATLSAGILPDASFGFAPTLEIHYVDPIAWIKAHSVNPWCPSAEEEAISLALWGEGPAELEAPQIFRVRLANALQSVWNTVPGSRVWTRDLQLFETREPTDALDLSFRMEGLSYAQFIHRTNPSQTTGLGQDCGRADLAQIEVQTGLVRRLVLLTQPQTEGAAASIATLRHAVHQYFGGQFLPDPLVGMVPTPKAIPPSPESPSALTIGLERWGGAVPDLQYVQLAQIRKVPIEFLRRYRIIPYLQPLTIHWISDHLGESAVEELGQLGLLRERVVAGSGGRRLTLKGPGFLVPLGNDQTVTGLKMRYLSPQIQFPQDGGNVFNSFKARYETFRALEVRAQKLASGHDLFSDPFLDLGSWSSPEIGDQTRTLTRLAVFEGELKAMAFHALFALPVLSLGGIGYFTIEKFARQIASLSGLKRVDLCLDEDCARSYRRARLDGWTDSYFRMQQMALLLKKHRPDLQVHLVGGLTHPAGDKVDLDEGLALGVLELRAFREGFEQLREGSPAFAPHHLEPALVRYLEGTLECAQIYYALLDHLRALPYRGSEARSVAETQHWRNIQDELYLRVEATQGCYRQFAQARTGRAVSRRPKSFGVDNGRLSTGLLPG